MLLFGGTECTIQMNSLSFQYINIKFGTCVNGFNTSDNMIIPLISINNNYFRNAVARIIR